jgi:hypothetical protein
MEPSQGASRWSRKNKIRLGSKSWPETPQAASREGTARCCFARPGKIFAEESCSMSSQQSKAELLENLRTMLKDVFALRTGGVAYARLARAHGYVDGYMRVLLETNIADKNELLALVAEERELADGPATATLGGAATAAA